MRSSYVYLPQCPLCHRANCLPFLTPIGYMLLIIKTLPIRQSLMIAILAQSWGEVDTISRHTRSIIALVSLLAHSHNSLIITIKGSSLGGALVIGYPFTAPDKASSSGSRRIMLNSTILSNDGFVLPSSMRLIYADDVPSLFATSFCDCANRNRAFFKLLPMI